MDSSINDVEGCLGGSAVECLPSAGVMTLDPGMESSIRLPVGSLLLPLPMSLPLSVFLKNKLKKQKQKQKTPRKQADKLLQP